MRSDDVIATLTRLCAQEKEMITRGKLDELAPLIVRKQALVDELADMNPEGLALVRDLLGRSQTLIEAAIKGVKSARLRLLQIRNAGDAINSYDPAGKTRIIGDSSATVERRF
jgi:flagellar biosynthesis/type III secretory pathway chaperone